ncbi:MAG: ferritin [Deltaproteobacteria bacterium]|nr:ferritin [Deltaproteobacteria bacterium]
MNLNKKMEGALDAQLQLEAYSSYLYLSMSAFCHSINLKGFGHWMRQQSHEEHHHAMKIFDYMVERGNWVSLLALEKPAHAFKSVRDVIESSLAHEQKVTAQIHKLYELAGQQKDYATQMMLQWFITEQVEEEATVKEILEKLKRISDKGSAILYLDKELGKRAATT